jgi:tetratricopeptide (TPR) repeat protein
MHPARGINPPPIEDALIASAVLGGGLPFKAERHLRRAGLCYHLDDIAEHHLNLALEVAPEHAAVLIGFYRFYFYKGRLREALAIARTCLAKAARELNIAGDWRLVRAADAEFGAYENILPRFYLFTLKGYAYLHMRLGDIEEGRAAAMKLLEIEPTDKIGARVLLEVLHRIGADDDD